MKTSQDRRYHINDEQALQVRIELYKTRNPEKVARIMGYKLDVFSQVYARHFGMTPQQDLDSTNRGRSPSHYDGEDHGNRLCSGSRRTERGYSGKSRLPSSKAHSSFIFDR